MIFNFVHYTEDSLLKFSLLELNDRLLLLDCGISELFTAFLVEHSFNITHLFDDSIKQLAHKAPLIDAVLLSKADLYTIGYLPFLLKKLRPECPILSTLPVLNFARLIFREYYHSLQQSYGLADPPPDHGHTGDWNTPYTLKQVDETLNRIIPLRFGQFVDIGENLSGFRFTPLSSGIDIGACYWKIIIDDDEEILYIPRISSSKHNVFVPADISGFSKKSSLVITSCLGVLDSCDTLDDRKKKISDAIVKAGNQKLSQSCILLPSDYNSSLIETFLILGQILTVQALASESEIIFLSRTSTDFLRFIKSSCDNSEKDFAATISQLIDCCTCIDEFQKLKSHPFSKRISIIVGTLSSLDAGLIHDFLVSSDHSGLTFILPDGQSIKSLSGKIASSKSVNTKVILRQLIELSAEEKSQLLIQKAKEESEKNIKQEFEKFYMHFTSSNVITDENAILREQITSAFTHSHYFWTRFKNRTTDNLDLKRIYSLQPNQTKASILTFKIYREALMTSVASEYGLDFKYINVSMNPVHEDRKIADTPRTDMNTKWITDSKSIKLSYNKVVVCLPKTDFKTMQYIFQKTSPEFVVLYGGNLSSKRHVYNYLTIGLQKNPDCIILANEAESVHFQTRSMTQLVNLQLNANVQQPVSSTKKLTMQKGAFSFVDLSTALPVASKHTNDYLLYGEFKLNEARKLMLEKSIGSSVIEGEIRGSDFKILKVLF